MIARLRKLESDNTPIRVGLVGAGSMGLGVALQVLQTPGMELAFIADHNQDVIDAALSLLGLAKDKVHSDVDAYHAMDHCGGFQVLVESTNCIAPAYGYCAAAMMRGAHVVLMNAEVDLAFGPLLQRCAAQNGVVCTSDAGDQHGVLMRMIDEICLWGFKIVQAGNIKGFHDRYATAESLAHEAAIRHLDPVQCCAYTDGTKLNIEMALLANGTGLVPAQRGMIGPRCDSVHDVFDAFDLNALPSEGAVDYILGAEPGGGVYVIGHCDQPIQQRYLNYYKLGEGPYYLFYRPYHLCHLETTRAIAYAFLDSRAILRPIQRPIADVYAFAKKPLRKGDTISHGIGGDECYGLIDLCSVGNTERLAPIWLLEGEAGSCVTLVEDKEIDEAITLDDLSFPETTLLSLWNDQRSFLAGSSFKVIQGQQSSPSGA